MNTHTVTEKISTRNISTWDEAWACQETVWMEILWWAPTRIKVVDDSVPGSECRLYLFSALSPWCHPCVTGQMDSPAQLGAAYLASAWVFGALSPQHQYPRLLGHHNPIYYYYSTKRHQLFCIILKYLIINFETCGAYFDISTVYLDLNKIPCQSLH